MNYSIITYCASSSYCCISKNVNIAINFCFIFNDGVVSNCDITPYLNFPENFSKIINPYIPTNISIPLTIALLYILAFWYTSAVSITTASSRTCESPYTLPSSKPTKILIEKDFCYFQSILQLLPL